jgi:hypothetical protein
MISIQTCQGKPQGHDKSKVKTAKGPKPKFFGCLRSSEQVSRIYGFLITNRREFWREVFIPLVFYVM